MKKTYSIPTIKLREVKTEQSLLAGSPALQDEMGDGQQLSKPVAPGFRSIWDDEDIDEE